MADLRGVRGGGVSGLAAPAGAHAVLRTSAFDEYHASPVTFSLK